MAHGTCNDDVLIHTESFDCQMKYLEEVLKGFSEAKLQNCKTKQIFFGFETIQFLGYNVGNGPVTPIARILAKKLFDA